MTLASVSFQTEFAVDMTCQSCVEEVSGVLRDIPGIERYDIDLPNKRVTITGRTPPSQLLSALRSTSRQTLVRGASSLTQTSFLQQAAVAILESPLPLTSTTNSSILSSLPSKPSTHKDLPGMNEEEHTQKVFGICRFVQIAPQTILMDLTVRLPSVSQVGLRQAPFKVYISQTGNMVNPPESTGKSYLELGNIVPDKDGYGDMFKEVSGELWEWIGRGCLVQVDRGEKVGPGEIFAGVVARSSGVWGNEKIVCACSGRTMWEEGREMDKISGGEASR
ncbi:copper chaperone for superoxide dismutase, partial [Tremellales sp. Uapishka_1]